MQLIPLSEGFFWKYESKTIDSNGDIIDEEVITNQVMQSFNSAGYDWHVMEEFGDVFIVRNDEKGQWEGLPTEEDFSHIVEQSLFLEYPVNMVPYHYKQSFELIDEDTEYEGDEESGMPINQIRVSSLNEKVETPAGEFECIVYHIKPIQVDEETGDFEIAIYIAPGTGVIKHTITADGEQTVANLIEFVVE